MNDEESTPLPGRTDLPYSQVIRSQAGLPGWRGRTSSPPASSSSPAALSVTPWQPRGVRACLAGLTDWV